VCSGDKLAEVVEKIEASGGEGRAIVADVTQGADIERVVRETVETLGGIDVVVNAAGIIVVGPIENT
jgi:3-oxoacyl-[acyl-carrier protein] reductase